MLTRRRIKLTFALAALTAILYGFSALTEAAQNGFGTRNSALTEAIDSNNGAK